MAFPEIFPGFRRLHPGYKNTLVCSCSHDAMQRNREAVEGLFEVIPGFRTLHPGYKNTTVCPCSHDAAQRNRGTVEGLFEVIPGFRTLHPGYKNTTVCPCSHDAAQRNRGGSLMPKGIVFPLHFKGGATGVVFIKQRPPKQKARPDPVLVYSRNHPKVLKNLRTHRRPAIVGLIFNEFKQ